VYDVPFVKPDTVQLPDAPVTVHVKDPGVEVTRYEAGIPPVPAATVTTTDDDPATTVGANGALGAGSAADSNDKFRMSIELLLPGAHTKKRKETLFVVEASTVNDFATGAAFAPVGSVSRNTEVEKLSKLDFTRRPRGSLLPPLPTANFTAICSKFPDDFVSEYSTYLAGFTVAADTVKDSGYISYTFPKPSLPT